MAEKKQYHLIINHLRVLSKKDAKQYASELMNNPYSEDRGWGYSDVIRMGEVISATLQKRILTYIVFGMKRPKHWNVSLSK